MMFGTKDLLKKPLKILGGKMGKPGSDFSKLINECRSKKSDRLIYNASYDHALELFRALFDEAREHKLPVKITSGNLRFDFYKSLVDAAEKALNNEVKINLAVLNPETDVNLKDHLFVKLLRENNCEVYQATEKVKGMHFILVGDNRFRFETDHKQTKAVACFNNPKIGKILNAEFDNIVNLSKMKPLQAA